MSEIRAVFPRERVVESLSRRALKSTTAAAAAAGGGAGGGAGVDMDREGGRGKDEDGGLTEKEGNDEREREKEEEEGDCKATILMVFRADLSGNNTALDASLLPSKLPSKQVHQTTGTQAIDPQHDLQETLLLDAACRLLQTR